MQAFISYCHNDYHHYDRFKTHLATLKRNKLIDDWSDVDIQAGQNIDNEIKLKMNSAELFLMLVSPDFLNSGYCIDTELQYAVKRKNSGSATIVPIIIEPCDWHSIPELSDIKALPQDGKPVSVWANPNSAWFDVVTGLKLIVTNWKPYGDNSVNNQPMCDYIIVDGGKSVDFDFDTRVAIPRINVKNPFEYRFKFQVEPLGDFDFERIKGFIVERPNRIILLNAKRKKPKVKTDNRYHNLVAVHIDEITDKSEKTIERILDTRAKFLYDVIKSNEEYCKKNETGYIPTESNYYEHTNKINMSV